MPRERFEPKNYEDGHEGVLTHYQLLGITSEATPEEIVQAYNRSISEYGRSRDSGREATENFGKLDKAYEVLSDQKRKKEYDRWLASKSESMSTLKKVGLSLAGGAVVAGGVVALREAMRDTEADKQRAKINEAFRREQEAKQKEQQHVIFEPPLKALEKASVRAVAAQRCELDIMIGFGTRNPNKISLPIQAPASSVEVLNTYTEPSNNNTLFITYKVLRDQKEIILQIKIQPWKTDDGKEVFRVQSELEPVPVETDITYAEKFVEIK